MTRNDWTCPVPGHGKRLSGYTRPYCPHSGHDKTGGHFFDSTSSGGGLPLPSPDPSPPSPRRAADSGSAPASASLPAFGLLFPGEGPDAG